MASITDHYGIALAVDRGSKAHFQTNRILYRKYMCAKSHDISCAAKTSGVR